MEEIIVKVAFVGIVLVIGITLFFAVTITVLPYERTFDCRKGEVADRYNYGLFHLTIREEMKVPAYIEQCRG